MSEHDYARALGGCDRARAGTASGNKSYTRQLLDAGTERCAKKFGEEAVETVLAAVNADPRS